jgi:ribose transport system ATP-binding protein
MDTLVRGGIGVIVISSELPEIIGIADRVIVMREGVTVGELGGTASAPVTQEAIMELATAAGDTAMWEAMRP